MRCAIFTISHTVQIHLIKNVTRLVNLHVVFDCFIGMYAFRVFVDDDTLASMFTCLLL